VRGVGQPSDQATEVGRERRRPPRASGHVATKALENEASQTQSHARTRRPETILFSRSRTSHPKTHSQTRRGLPDGQCENPHHRKTSTPTRPTTRQTDYTLVCEEPVYLVVVHSGAISTIRMPLSSFDIPIVFETFTPGMRTLVPFT